ncbi:MAG: beta-ketoacyl synthase N-terminal-like domain-containing protein, partial [Cyanobacteria bacterium P01_G01_bin.19]
GKDGVSQVPESRWDIDEFYDPDLSKPGKANTKWGGFLEDDISLFDPQFFGIAPKEAVTIDPQQRLLLEVAWETLEDAGQIPEDLRGSKTGVFIGIGTHDYSIAMWQQPVSEPYATTGTGNCIAANRISYLFDFKAPSLAVDTACSSSLVAVHLACQSIWTGESSQALTGGVNMLLLPTIMVGFSKGGFMSGRGRCQSFDADADGYVRGEGAGLILLKPLSQAEADGDNIYGVILSSAVNQDGFSNGMAAPNPEAQAAVLQEAYRRGNIDPREVDYIEAHGTGTKIGDPIEMQALGEILGKNRPSGNNCLVGSVKTNIGHTETAAGIAGIIKVLLAFKHKQIPPSLHFNTPNPAIAFAENNLQVVTELTPWQQDKQAIAGVNSFGFGGTNAHVVLADVATEKCEPEKTIEKEPSLQLFTVSAKSKNALRDFAQSYGETIRHSAFSLEDICTASNIKRSHFNHRLTCIAKIKEQLSKQLLGFVAEKEALGVNYSCVGNKSVRVCWMFTGQGSQYVGMGEELYRTQLVFRHALDRCAAILESYLDVPLLEVVFEPAVSAAKLDLTQYTQPAIFAIEYALAQLWLSWGVTPDYVMGHSIGEYVAACIAGVFNLEDGLKLVAHRGKLMGKLPSGGGMLAVFCDPDKVADFILRYDDTVSIAAINNQENTVISGNKDTLAQVQADFAKIDIKSTSLSVSHAFHSPLMKPILADFQAEAEKINYATPQISLVSCVTGSLAGIEILNSDYWTDHIIQSVKFADAFRCLLEQQVNIFLEIGTKPILSSISQTILLGENNSSDVLFLPSLSNKQEDRQVLLNSLSNLYHQGIEINWQGFNKSHKNSNVKLPTYPFQRQKYWWQAAKFWEQDNYNQHKNPHTLLGEKTTSADSSKIKFENQIDLDRLEYLRDHCLGSEVVFPATGYLEIILAAIKEVKGNLPLEISNFTIKQPLFLDSEITNIETIIDRDRLQIFSKNSDLVLHSEATLETAQKQSLEHIDLEETKLGLEPVSNISNYYQKLSSQGLNYGKYFQGIKQLWQGNNRALGYIEIAEEITGDRDLLHPALLDSCLQLIGAAIESDDGVYIPVGIESLRFDKPTVNRVWAEVRINSQESDRVLQADLKVINSLGEVITAIENLSLQYLSQTSFAKLIDKSTETSPANLSSDLYEIIWSPQELNTQRQNQLPQQWLIYHSKGGRHLELAQKLPGNKIFLSSGEKFSKTAEVQYQVNPQNVEDFKQLWQEIENRESWGIICLNPDNIAAILHLIQSIPASNLSQLVVVINPTQIKHEDAAKGIGGTIKSVSLEYPDLNCIYLEQESNNTSIVIDEIEHNHKETEVAYRDKHRYVTRLIPRDNTLSHPFRLQLSDYGSLDNLLLAPMQRQQPQAGEIEIAVTASGVNFRDVLNALGLLKQYLETMGFSDASQVPFGGECVGTVTAVGEGVKNFQPGDEVIAAQAVGSLSSHVTVDAR